jgi:hypothetical protein
MHKVAAGMLVMLLSGRPAEAQVVVIPHATPAAVVDRLKAQLVPQGFKLESANDKNALFTLDRGLVAQRGNADVPIAHVFIELQFRFKQESEGLSVTANEEAVGERGRPAEFRKPVLSDRDNLQRLLESVRVGIEAGTPGDSATKRDSTHH